VSAGLYGRDMDSTTDRPKLSFIRQVFPTWWISIPPDFEETFVRGEDYWHAWDRHRSVSLSSVLLTDPARRNRPVSASEILARMPPPPGDPVAPPPGLRGWAVVIAMPESPKASRGITGLIAVDGRVLIVTITADDIDWATRVWQSIEYGPEARYPGAGTPRLPAGPRAARH
jgi:hypothetical protein